MYHFCCGKDVFVSLPCSLINLAHGGHPLCHSQVIRQVFSARQCFVNTRQYLVILSHRISMEGYTRPFFPHPCTHKRKKVVWPRKTRIWGRSIQRQNVPPADLTCLSLTADITIQVFDALNTLQGMQDRYQSFSIKKTVAQPLHFLFSLSISKCKVPLEWKY